MKRRERMLHDLDEAIRQHIETETQDNIARGMSPQEARNAALRKFGNVTRVQEETREVWSFVWLEQFWQDVRYALRMLRKSPGFTAIAVLTLALGIGANTAIFSVVYAVLLRPLPYPNPDQLVLVFQANPQDQVPFDGMSYVNFEKLREHNSVFSELASNTRHELTLTGVGDPSVLSTVDVTPEIFSVLAVQPLLGRTFFPQDGKRGAPPVVILSENLWRSRFRADPQLLGRSISLDKRLFTVVGIMPSSFRFPLIAIREDIWIPIAQDPMFGPWMSRFGGHWLLATGRLKPGVFLAQARAQMDAMSAALAKDDPANNTGWQIRVDSLQQQVVGDSRPALLILLGAVGLVLLIACVNIANLLLSRASSRAREVAVRIALGAGRKRIVRQLLTESAVLGLLGGIAGILLAYWGVHALISLLPPDLPRADTIRVDGGVLAFALLLAVASSFIFGLAPSLFAADSSLQTSLREASSRSGEGARQRGTRTVLAIAEIALAMVLLVAAGLLLRSFTMLTAVNPGFDPAHVVKADVSLPQFQYSTPQQWTAFSNEFLERLQAQPGLQDAAMAVPLPLNEGSVNLAFDIVGNPPLPPGTAITADFTSVSPDYFHVMSIPLLRGRLFNAQDSAGTPRVTVISEELARRYFRNQDPMGKQLNFGFPPDGDAPREIVGIVGDVRDNSLSEAPGPMMYVPFAQAPFWGAQVIVRSTLSPSSVAASIRKTTHEIDKDLPVTDIETLPEALSVSVAQPRFRTLLLGLFGVIALLLAAVGIFGVLSYSVARRTHEIGIRIALGATPGKILRLVLTESAKLIVVGLAVGIPAALALTRYLATLLFAVHPTDPLTFIGVAILLTSVALIACYVPARRAMQVDPIISLRYE
ncbi:MAG: ABC transporter permease [Candidatus Acidiferrales bacterium]